jgi:xylulose-5-phosphate/fructose-6-phosphate phosphoketolase
MDDGLALAQVGGQVPVEALQRWQRATNYLAAARIYLRDNCLLEEPLRPEHVKERLDGHWGTVPGLNLVHAHLNRLVIEHDASVLLVTGPGHGAAASLANLYLDGSLAELRPEYTLDRAGLLRFVRSSTPELTPVPGAIHDGGELGYALATAFGAAFDNPDLIVACIVGDGEAETGPTAAAWHGTKFLDPATSGAVLPILDLNGYKASSPAIYSTLDDRELGELFAGLGWEPLLVSGPEVDLALANAVDVAFERIQALRESPRTARPRWPMVVLRTAKGRTGPERLDGHPLEGSFRAHGVPAGDLRTNPRHLEIVERWLRSYGPEELFDDDGRPVGLGEACPGGTRRIGLAPCALRPRPLDLPQLPELPLVERGLPIASATEHAAAYLRDLLVASDLQHSFRIVSPDALAASGLGGVLQVTGRAYTWPVGHDDVTVRPDGRVLEILSGDVCQGWLQGYLQTGRHGLFVASGSFAATVGLAAVRYARWLETRREPTPSLTYLLDRAPDLVAPGPRLRILYPPDANSLVVTLDRCLRETGSVNVVVGSPEPLPQWLSLDEAVAACEAGSVVWDRAGSGDPDESQVLLAAAGGRLTAEMLAAAEILRRELPDLSFRVVSVIDAGAVLEDGCPVVLAFEGDLCAFHGWDAHLATSREEIVRAVRERYAPRLDWRSSSS